MEQERVLIEAAQTDPKRFAELYESNFERVYAFIVRRVQDRHDAEDLTAEVFQHALANLSKFEWRGVPFAVWLFRIASNAIADQWRQNSKQRTEPISDDDLDQAHWPDVERRATLFQLVNSLPEAQRSVVFKRFVEQKKHSRYCAGTRQVGGCSQAASVSGDREFACAKREPGRAKPQGTSRWWP
jgi:RNA polymerase sigma-70 factor, ECF subfamily